MSAIDEREFQQWADERVLDAIKFGANSFVSLVTALGSIFPSVVVDSLERLATSGVLSQSAAATFKEQAARESDTPPPPSVVRGLPVPHPLDYDWRFSADSVRYLLEKHPDPRELLLCLGAPSVYSAAIHSDSRLQCGLLDGNSHLVTTLQPISPQDSVLCCDLLEDSLPAWVARTIIADPPWYPEYVKSFLWCGRVLLADQGRLLLSLPPEGTRPGVLQELADAVEWASLVGLRLVQIHRAAVRYVTPPFEQNALRAQGIYGVPRVWRTGDIVEFECVGHLQVPRPLSATYETPWTEVSLSGVRIRIAVAGENAMVSPQLVPLVQGDILPSVSRRDPRRIRVRVWTSGNRVFGCSDPRSFNAVASAYEIGDCPHTKVADLVGRSLTNEERTNVSTALRQMDSIVSAEHKEYASEWCHG